VPKLSFDRVKSGAQQAIPSPNFDNQSKNGSGNDTFKEKLSNLKCALKSIKSNLQQIKPLQTTPSGGGTDHQIDFKSINSPKDCGQLIPKLQ
jgi:hypothetical protein